MYEEQSDTAALSDEHLVALALKDRQQFAAIVRRYEAPLLRYLRRLGVRTNEDMEDLLQEIFIKAYRNLASFNRSLKFSSWLYRIAHNETVSWFRKVSVRPEGHYVLEPEDVLSLVAWSGEDAASQFDTAVAAEALRKELQALSDNYRDVIILRYFEHKEYEEISDILRMPVGTVGTLLHRAKEKLRQALGDNATIL